MQPEISKIGFDLKQQPNLLIKLDPSQLSLHNKWVRSRLGNSKMLAI